MSRALARRPAELAQLRVAPVDLAPPRPRRVVRPAFVRVYDTREQTPWWQGEDGVERGTLQIGDYSIKGCEARPPSAERPNLPKHWGVGQVAVERKSLEDLYATIGESLKERERERKAGDPDATGRGERQWRRLGELVAAGGTALYVVEASMAEIVCPESSRRDWRSGLHPNALMGCLCSWSQRFGVPWIPAGCPALAQRFVAGWLASWWRYNQEEI